MRSMIAWFLGRGSASAARLSPDAGLTLPRAAAAPATARPVLAAETEARFLGLATGLDIAVSDDPAASGKALRRFGELCRADRFDVQQLPRLPAILPELLAQLRVERLDRRQLAPLIRRDAVLHGEVMRLVNSTHYGTRRPIRSLPQAIVMLGDEGLRRLVVRALARPIHHGANGSLAGHAARHYSAHAECCADLCVDLVRKQGDAFEAHLAGMFAQAGALPILRLLDRQPELVAELQGCAWAPAFESATAALSALAAAHWQLPEPVVSALSQRHADALAPGVPVLVTALATANLQAKARLLRER